MWERFCTSPCWYKETGHLLEGTNHMRQISVLPDGYYQRPSQTLKHTPSITCESSSTALVTQIQRRSVQGELLF